VWDFLVRQIARQAFKQGGKQAFGIIADPLNESEVYVERIKRDFHIDDYYKALELYNSDPAYWQQYYRPPPRLDAAFERIRDSVAMAGVPSRYNVWEYDYPDANSNPSSPNPASTSKSGQAASPVAPAPAFAPDAVYSPMGDFYGNFPPVTEPAGKLSLTTFDPSRSSMAAGSPNDELSPLQRSLQSGLATIGAYNGVSPAGFLGTPPSNPFGNGVESWASSVNPTSPFYAVPPSQQTDQPSGLPGMLLDYLRDNSSSALAGPTQAAAASQLPDASQELPPLQPDETQGAADNRPQRFLGRRTYSLSDPSPLPQRSSLAAPMSSDGPLSINEAYEYLKRLNASLA